MQLLKFIKFSWLIQLIVFTQVEAEKKWSYDIVEISSSTTNPDWIDLVYNVERIGRGQFGFSGFFDIKTDLYDDTLVRAYVERSKYRIGPYIKLPMSVDYLPLTAAMNTFYKDILMPSIQNCSENAPYFEDKFKPPLTKRKVEFSKCLIFTDNMPNIMMEGYHKLTIALYGEYKVDVVTLVLIEKVDN